MEYWDPNTEHRTPNTEGPLRHPSLHYSLTPLLPDPEVCQLLERFDCRLGPEVAAPFGFHGAKELVHQRRAGQGQVQLRGSFEREAQVLLLETDHEPGREVALQ